jgi:hypothetical protein
MTAMSFLEDLQAAARDAEAAEAAFRREVAARMAGLEQQRAFAFRRFNLMQAIAEAVGPAEDSRPRLPTRLPRCGRDSVGKATARLAPRCRRALRRSRKRSLPA